MSTSDKPGRGEPLPTFDEHAHSAEQHDADPQGEPATQEYYTDEHQQYDEHGQPYSEEQQYDEHGQPYSEEQQYDEHGQPYANEDGYAEQQEPPYDDAPTAQIDTYPTAPQFAGPQGMGGPPSSHHHMVQAPFSRRPLGAPPSQGGPYRIPIAPEPQTIPQAWRPAAPKTPRPVIGSMLAVYGILLWSFVVAGQFATSWITGTPMNNGTALFIVVAATFIAWAFSIRRSGMAAPMTTPLRTIGRSIATLFLANILFWITVLLATMAGQAASRNHDFAIAFFLVLAGVGATILGPRLTMPVRPELTHGARFAVVSMWIVGAIVTFIAGAELATNG